MRKICVIVGLTATGKSDAAIKIAQKWNAEIISADSVAVYKGLDIGSAKATIDEQKLVPHHLINVMNYKEPFNVALFQKMAREKILEIQSRGKNVIVVGGTGLYIKALLYDYRFEEEDNAKYERTEDTPTLFEELLDKDPEATKSIHPNNRKRIIRALESFEKNQKNRSDITKNNKDEQIISADVFFLQGDRAKIYERINQRVDLMFEKGLEQEVRDFYNKDQAIFSYISFQSIGYREFEAYFNEDINIDELKELIKRNTRRFAKRQITWFKHQQPSQWIDIFTEDIINKIYETLVDDKIQN